MSILRDIECLDPRTRESMCSISRGSGAKLLLPDSSTSAGQAIESYLISFRIIRTG